MNVRQFALGTTLGLLALTAAGSASAGEWQALRGMAATPMTAAQMEAVQGKAGFDLSGMAPVSNSVYLQRVFGTASYTSISVDGRPIYTSIGPGGSIGNITYVVSGGR